MKLLTAYKQLQEKAEFPGWAIRPFVPDIAALIDKYKSLTLLDYGCGMGYQYSKERVHHRWGGLRPTLYDPAVPTHDKLPEEGKLFDGVICTDVLEHIPEDELAETVTRIYSYARQWVFISVCPRPAKRVFPDGTNVHVTVRPVPWWDDLLKTHAKPGVRTAVGVTN